MKEIDFWFSIGSTYTYLSVTRLTEVSQKTGASFSWKPFSVRKIMREMDNIPFPPNKQTKVGHEAGSDVNLTQTLSEVGQDKLRVLELADSSDVEAAYLNQTESAKQAGIFGSPSFIVDGELFWGDDRLEDAINWASKDSYG